jgi:hypothetical protein
MTDSTHSSLTTTALLNLVKETTPDVQKGQVVGLDREGTREALPAGVVGWLEEHPEGEDRGGYVPTLFLTRGPTHVAGVYYHEGEWLPFVS